MSGTRKTMRVVPKLAGINPFEDEKLPKEEEGGCVGAGCPDAEEEEGAVATNPGITLEDTGVEVTKDTSVASSEEMEVSLSAEEQKEVSAALTKLARAGVGSIALASKKAHFFKVDPENPQSYSQVKALVERQYKGDLSQNDAFFFSVPEGQIPGGKIASGTSTPKREMVAMSRELLATIVRNATEIGARNAVSVVFEQLKKAGYELRSTRQSSLAENYGKKGKTNIQAEIEDSHTPTRAVVDAAEFDKAKPRDLEALEFVADLKFDEFTTDKIVDGRKINRTPADAV